MHVVTFPLRLLALFVLLMVVAVVAAILGAQAFAIAALLGAGLLLYGATGPVPPWAASFLRHASADSGNLIVIHGQATTVTASDTIDLSATMTTVLGCGAQLSDAPVIGCDRASASYGDQAGTPAAGRILVQTWKPTAAGDATPIAATTFSKKVNYWAIGTAKTPIQ